MATFAAASVILDSATVHQVRQTTHRGGNTARKGRISGGVAVSQVSGLMAEEVTNVTSTDMATLVALNTNTFCSAGLYIASGTITVPLKARTDGGAFASGSNHCAIGGTKAFVVPTMFEASQDADADASCAFDIHWISANGTAKAATGSTGNALGTQSFVSSFALGPVYINTTQVVGIQSIRVNPGITVIKSRREGLTFPVKCSIQEVTPTIEFTTDDADAVIALISSFNAMTSANVFFRKRNDAGVYVADVTTEHIKFTFAGGLYFSDSVDVSENNNGTSTVTLHGKTLTASAASAIS